MNKRAIIIAEFPAPYRVSVFNTLMEKYDIVVFFHMRDESSRSNQYSVKKLNFTHYYLDTKVGRNYFWKEVCKIDTYDFALIYNFCFSYAVVLYTRATFAKVPTFLNADGGFINHHPIKDIVKRFIVKNCTMYFSSGEAADAYFYEYGGNKNKIRHHNFTSLNEEDILEKPVSQEDKQKLKKKLGLDENSIYVISVGQFIFRKGFDLLINAWKQIDAQDKEYKLLIIGGGELRSDLETQIQRDKLDQSIVLIDFMKKIDLIEYYKASDVFCILTREDVWGLVINEAMALGLPVVTTKQCVAGNELILNGENGFIVDCEDITGASESLLRLLTDENLRKRMSYNNIIKMQGNTMKNIGLSHINNIENYFSMTDRKNNNDESIR